MVGWGEVGDVGDVVRCVGMWVKAVNKSSEDVFCLFHDAEGIWRREVRFCYLRESVWWYSIAMVGDNVITQAPIVG